MVDWPTATGIAVIGAAYFSKDSYRLLYPVKCTLAYFGGFVITTIWFPFCLLRPFNVSNLSLMEYPLKLLSWMLGVYCIPRDFKNLEPSVSGIIVCNHQSQLDSFVVAEILSTNRNMIVIMRKNMAKVLPLSLGMWLSKSLFLDNLDLQSSNRVIDKCLQTAIAKKGCKIFVFPEVKRNVLLNITNTLLPFKLGPFRAAIRGQVPIFPVVASPHYFADSKRCFFGRGYMLVKALPCIETEGLTEEDAEMLMQEVYNKMQKTYDKITLEIYNTYPQEVKKYLSTGTCK